MSYLCTCRTLTRKIFGFRKFSQSSVQNAGKLGFIGLGNMGGHMAANLMEKGHSLLVYDLVPESVKTAVELGAEAAETPAEVAEKVDSIVTMLPDSACVRKVYTGDDGIFKKVRGGTLLLDSSTIDPSASVEMSHLANQKACKYMDAPVSGGVLAAKAATLTFMVGGDENEFEAAKELLQHMGKNVVYCGAVGSGQAAKICNNMLLAISMIGTSEAMNLGTRLGLDAKLLANVLNTSSGRCWSSEVYNPYPGVLPNVPSSKNYQGGFGTALMTKDLGLAQTAARETKSITPLGSAAFQIYQMLCAHGLAEKDFSSVFKFIQNETSN